MPMRSSDFRMNTEYLSLANVDNYTFSATVPTTTIGGSGTQTYTFDFSVPKTPQVICRYFLHHSTWDSRGETVYMVGGNLDVTWGAALSEKPFEYITTSNPSNGIIRISVRLVGDSGQTIPSHGIGLKVFRYKIPNIF